MAEQNKGTLSKREKEFTTLNLKEIKNIEDKFSTIFAEKP